MMVTTPLIEKPDRFGSPSSLLGIPSYHQWEDDSVFECRVLLCPEDEGGYSAHALRLPGVVSQGETVTEALDNIKEAFRGAIGVYLEDGQEIPLESIDMDRPAESLERWVLVNV